MMITPSIEQLTQGKFNRYALVIATAKCARIVTDEYVAQRELAEKNIADKKTEKTIASQIDKDIRDNKAVKTAIKRLMQGEYVVMESNEEGEMKPMLEKDAHVFDALEEAENAEGEDEEGENE